MPTDRRTFIRNSAVLGVTAGAASFPAGAKTRTLGFPGVGEPGPFELDEMTVTDLQKRMQSGQDTAKSLVEKYLARIDKLETRGPSLHCMIEINPEAMSIAEAIDVERRTTGVRGALHGIPVLIKDNIGTADRMTTTAGSLALEGSIPAKDSYVAARLREAGAVILGKTNLSEWANFRSTRSSSGWSARGGQAKNPYALDRNPSGSSSGTAGAVAANYGAVGLGTETDGSITSPSNNCCVVGIKPTVGLISRSGVVPIAHSQDTVGPMTRTVTDAAILLGAIAGPDADDPVTKNALVLGHRDYTKFLIAGGLKGARIGIPRDGFFGYNPHADKIAEDAIAIMKRLGAVIVDPVELPDGDELGKAEYEVLLYEFKADLAAYLAGLGPSAPIKSLQDAIDFNERNRAREMPYFGQEIFIKAQAKGPLAEQAYLDALATCERLSRTEGIDAAMDKHALDALVAPTSAPPSLTDLVNGDYGSGSATTFPAVAGYPHITVPGGFVFGLPVGVSFFGRAWSEPTLLKLAYAFEQATRHRRPPAFLPTAKL